MGAPGQYSDEAQKAQLLRSLTNVTPSPEQVERIELVRQVAKALGVAVIENVPAGRQRSLAITHLEDAAMWAVKGIVLEESDV